MKASHMQSATHSTTTINLHMFQMTHIDLYKRTSGTACCENDGHISMQVLDYGMQHDRNRPTIYTMVGFMCKSAAIVGALLIIALAVCVQQIAIPLVKNMGVVVSGYTAKIACSAVFVQERTTESVANGELSGFPFHLVEFVVDGGTKAYKHTAKHCFIFPPADPLAPAGNETVVATAPWGLGEQVAVYRDNFGCTLLQGYDGSYSRELTTPARPPVPLPTSDSGLGGRIDRDPTAPFPLGDATLTPARKAVMMTLDKDALEAAVEHAFTEYDPKHPIHTRAVVVVHRGQVVAERYAPPYTPMSRFAGWSMTKSLLSALIGIRIKHRRLDLHATGVLPEWVAQEGDPRAAITIDHLLRMSRYTHSSCFAHPLLLDLDCSPIALSHTMCCSGLDWEEAYAKTRVADVAHMLYAEPDTAKYAASKKLAYEPDTAFAYELACCTPAPRCSSRGTTSNLMLRRPSTQIL